MKTMDQITIPKSILTDEQYAYHARQLGMAIVYKAAKDYCKSESAPTRKAILKDLRSDHLDFISDGMSVVTADHLEKDCEAITERIVAMERCGNG